MTALMASSLKSPISPDGFAWKKGLFRQIPISLQHARFMQFNSIPAPQHYSITDSELDPEISGIGLLRLCSKDIQSTGASLVECAVL